MTSQTLLFFVLFLLGNAICKLKAQSCGGTHSSTASSGVLLSPNYPNVYNNSCQCTYIISLTTSSSILLTFEVFELDRSTPTGDNVTISCASNSSYSQRTYYWNSVATPISIPWCRSARLYFQSDNYNMYSVRGFKIQYQISTVGCGNTVYTETSGNITSPNYPQDYNNNENCTYLIWTSQPSSFTLIFKAFSLESDGSNCPYDWVQIRCDYTNYMLPKYCGSAVPMPVSINNCNQVLVWFHTGAIRVRSGFRLQYFVTPNVSSSITTSIAPTSTEPDSGTTLNTTISRPTHCWNDAAVIIPIALLEICVLGYIALALYYVIQRFRVRSNTSQDGRQNSAENMEIRETRSVGQYISTPTVLSQPVYDHNIIPIPDLQLDSSTQTEIRDSHTYEYLNQAHHESGFYDTILEPSA